MLTGFSTPEHARPTMLEVQAQANPAGKFSGVVVDLVGLGKTRLTQLLSQNAETSVYRADHPGVVVKIFDLECGKADEVSYGPYVAYNLERENFEDISAIADLKRCVPGFYSANLDFEKKYAFISMEYFAGETLLEWCQTGENLELDAWAAQLRAAVHKTLAVVTRFHHHGIYLIDFKPDNVIRLSDGRIRFVDLGAFFTPRHQRQTEKFVYSATPDYAELVIDTSNVQTGLPLNQLSDIFAAGVALFEMSTGRSRVAVADATCDELLSVPELYRFRDTQIRDVWHAYPHLKDALPLVEVQLRERRILFAEIWYLIKGLLARGVPDWEGLPEERRQEMVLQTGLDLIQEQLPWKLDWLAQAIARATAFRSMRLKSMAELMRLVANPVSAEIQEDVLAHNLLAEHLQAEGASPTFVGHLNTWDVRPSEVSGHWAVSVSAAYQVLQEMAPFVFLKCLHAQADGHRFYQITSDLDADNTEGGPLTVSHLEEDPFAWLGM